VTVAWQVATSPERAASNTTSGLTPPMSDFSTTALNLWHGLMVALSFGYAHAPALMIGLSALLVLPVLAVLGFLLGQKRPAPLPEPGEPRSVDLARRRRDWLEVEGEDGARHLVDRDLMRIGREDDNEIRLSDEQVHRYHAILHRSGENGLVIRDLSGPDGNGVRVNGERVLETVLIDGDRVQLGATRLRFGRRQMAAASPVVGPG
jgi:hypothetical protein